MANKVESSKTPLLSARQVGIAAAFGGAALAVVAAGILIPIPGTLVVTDPRELFTTIGASLTGPIGGIVVGFLAGIADPLPIVAVISHVLGGIFNGLVYKHASWRFKDNKVVSLALWAARPPRGWPGLLPDPVPARQYRQARVENGCVGCCTSKGCPGLGARKTSRDRRRARPGPPG